MKLKDINGILQYSKGVLPILNSGILNHKGKLIFSNLNGWVIITLPSGETERLYAEAMITPSEDTNLSVGVDKLNRLYVIKEDGKAVAYEATDMPSIPRPEKGGVFPLTNTFKKGIKTVASFCSNDELRPAMTGVYFDTDKCVATDAHALTYVNHKFTIEPMVIDQEALKVLQHADRVMFTKSGDANNYGANLIVLFGKVEATTKVGVRKGDIQTEKYPFVYIGRDIDARFPEYERILPNVSNYSDYITLPSMVQTDMEARAQRSGSEAKEVWYNQGEFMFPNGESMPITQKEGCIPTDEAVTILMPISSEYELGFDYNKMTHVTKRDDVKVFYRPNETKAMIIVRN